MKIKIPEKAPDISSMTLDDHKKIQSMMTDEVFGAVISQANKKYLYWDRFKYKVPKDLIDPRSAWFYLKQIRISQRKSIPIIDLQNRSFNYWLPSQVMQYLHQIDCFAGGQISLDDPIINRESKERYLINSLMEEAVSSGLLEGAATTQKQGKAMLLSGRKPKTKADRMIYNNYQTIRKLESVKNEPLSVELLNKIHREITDKTLEEQEACGRFRTEYDDPVQVKDDQGMVLFDPPAVQEINERIENLIQFTNSEKADDEFIHPVIKAIILHFLLAYIHPFVDGNGRVARALFYWFMLKKGYWMVEYLSISPILYKAPAQYARAFLYTENDDQDLTYFISYHLKVLDLAFKQLRAYIEKKQRKVKLFSDVFKTHLDLNPRQTMLLQHALRHSGHIYTIQNHKIYHGVTYQTARTDFLNLTKRKIMEKIKRGKTFYFTLRKDVEKFLDA
ncbi:MAG: Fic family protein [Nitrospinae bacterium]|nr:Fic family protein [Nitrospinota bacterium]